MVDDLSAFYTVDGEEQQQQQQGKGEGKGKGKAAAPDARFKLKRGMEEEEGDESSGSEDEEEEGEEQDGEEKEEEGTAGKKPPAVSRDEMEERLEYLNRLARGEASDASASTSDSSSSDDDQDGSSSDGDEEDGDDDDGGVIESRRLEAGPVPMGEATTRLAIMNVDWDHLKAVDLLGVLLSFKPAAGRVARVTVYRSDYGMARMAEEARLGPGFLLREEKEAAAEAAEPEAAEASLGSSDEDEDEEEGEEEEGGEDVDVEKLRAYEIQRLRYHFAVAECDAVATAAALYEEVDGLEFEASAAQLDARFVPDGVEFGGRPVRDEAAALPSNYGASSSSPLPGGVAVFVAVLLCVWLVARRALTLTHKAPTPRYTQRRAPVVRDQGAAGDERGVHVGPGG